MVFEMIGVVLGGIEVVLKVRGIKVKGEDGVMIVGWVGDGGIVDIGF